MLIQFTPVYCPCKKCGLPPSLSYDPFTFARSWALYLLILEPESLHKRSVVWGVGTGGQDISHFRERCAKRVKNLTNRIDRMNAYPVAYGGFSDVWNCYLRHKQSPPEKVAVKAIRHVTVSDEESQVKRKAFERELRIWVQLEHPNVVPLYGITEAFGPFPAFVCPWADNGTLSEYLEEFETQLDLKKRMTLLRDVAAGLCYFHGDLSGSNVLITNDGRAWVSDFGLSTLLDTTVSGISFPGNIRWAAPELFDECGEGRPASQLASPQTDIYSFGSVMLQILTGKLPFHEVQRVAQIVIMISRGDKPSRELGWDGKVIPDMLWEFVESCWGSPFERPSCKKIVAFIEHQLSRL